MKHIGKSRTFLSGLAMALPQILPIFGVGVDDGVLIGEIADALISLLGLIGVAIFRSQAKHGVYFKKPKNKFHVVN